MVTSGQKQAIGGESSVLLRDLFAPEEIRANIIRSCYIINHKEEHYNSYHKGLRRGLVGQSTW